jgi:hypothetical protein
MGTDLVAMLSRQLPLLAKAAVSLPVAAVLCTVLAFRPRRDGTPPRDMEVVHTQIILGIVGALVMLVIGESLARAFGIVGAAGLIRYRASIADPKDAGVMLSALGLGLAAGVGLYLLATFATLFLLFVLWFVEARSPKPLIPYRLKIAVREPARLQPKIESIFRTHRITYELRNCTDTELDYDIQMPEDLATDTITIELEKLDSSSSVSFNWKRKKAA